MILYGLSRIQDHDLFNIEDPSMAYFSFWWVFLIGEEIKYNLCK